MTSPLEPEQIPLMVVVLTKNEEDNIGPCLRSASLLGAPVLVIDSSSTDRTADLARAEGADVVDFVWDGGYPKKKQWAVDHVTDHSDVSWILLLDADERVSHELAAFIVSAVAADEEGAPAAYRFPVEYHFAGGRNTHGFRAKKVALFRPDRTRFHPRDDLEVPNGWEVEGHYQPDVDGVVSTAPWALIHDDVDPLHDWIARHNRYSDWASFMDHRQGRVADESAGFAKRIFERLRVRGLLAFVDSYVLRRGFLDGSAGFDFAVARGFYYWMSAAKLRELRRRQQST